MTVVRKLHCDNPNCPHETLKAMSDWVRNELPDSSSGFMVSDLDFVLWNYKTRKLILLEVKTHHAECKNWQRNMWKNMNKWLKAGVSDGWEYLGFHLLVFHGKDFSNPIYYDNKEITEQELKQILSLGGTND